MDLINTIRTNGSVRSFRDTPVPDETVARILDSARFAPSGGNKQGWHVIVVKDQAKREQLAALAKMVWNEYAAITVAGARPFAADETGHWPGPPAGMDLAIERATDRPWRFDDFATAPVMLIVAVDLTVVAAMDVELDRIGVAAGASIYPFTQNILLAARHEDLAGVLTTFLVRQEPAARLLLNLPPTHAIAAMVVLGNPTHQNTKLTRKPVSEFATVDTFDGRALPNP